MLAAVIMEFVPTASLEGPQDNLMLPPPHPEVHPHPHQGHHHDHMENKKQLEEFSDSCQGLMKREFSWKKYYTRDTITPEGEKVTHLNESTVDFNLDLATPFMKFLAPKNEVKIRESTDISPALKAVLQESAHQEEQGIFRPNAILPGQEVEEKSTKSQSIRCEEAKKFPLRKTDSQMSILSEDGSENGEHHPVANRGDRRIFPTLKKWFFENNQNIEEGEEATVNTTTTNNNNNIPSKSPASPVLRARTKAFRSMNLWMPQAM